MKKLLFLAILLFSHAAFSAVPVNIVYPINGASYPVVSPGAHAEYITLSFGATCGGGPHNVRWGVDGTSLGSAKYYDQISVQQVYKLASGNHTFWVSTPCGNDKVWFNVK